MLACGVTRVEVPGEAAVQMVHALGQVRLRRLKEQVVMVRHQCEREQPPPLLVDGASQQLHPLLPVYVVAHNGLSLIAAARDVENRVGVLGPQRSGHDSSIPRWARLVKLNH